MRVLRNGGVQIRTAARIYLQLMRPHNRLGDKPVIERVNIERNVSQNSSLDMRQTSLSRNWTSRRRGEQ